MNNNFVTSILIESGLFTHAVYEYYLCPSKATYIHAFNDMIKTLKTNNEVPYLLWFLKDGKYFNSIRAQYNYEIITFVTVVRVKDFLKTYYQRTPLNLKNNSITVNSYALKKDMDIYHDQ